MVNGSQEIIFSQLLRDDDGVLRELLMSSGLSDIETAATIDRFIFELRHATESAGTEFEMEGLGTMSRDEAGKLIFTPFSKVIEQPVVMDEKVEEPIIEEPAAPTKETIEEVYKKIEQANAPRQRRAPRRVKSKGVDRVLVLGIVAAVVALAAIAYGVWASNIELILEILAK